VLKQIEVQGEVETVTRKAAWWVPQHLSKRPPLAHSPLAGYDDI
jgi:hypothetical protein